MAILFPRKLRVIKLTIVLPTIASLAVKYMDEPCSVKMGLERSATSFDQGQPAQSAQADLDGNLLLFVNFMYVPIILLWNLSVLLDKMEFMDLELMFSLPWYCA